MTDIMISVKPKYVRKILTGEKTVELRRRTVNVPSGTRVWIYSTLPRGAVEAVAVIERIENSTPNEIWHYHSGATGVTKREFEEYFEGSDHAVAIHLREVNSLSRPIPLRELRGADSTFHPPQFFRRMAGSAAVLAITLAGGLHT